MATRSPRRSSSTPATTRRCGCVRARGSRSPARTTTRCSASSRSAVCRCCSGSCSTSSYPAPRRDLASRRVRPRCPATQVELDRVPRRCDGGGGLGKSDRRVGFNNVDESTSSPTLMACRRGRRGWRYVNAPAARVRSRFSPIRVQHTAAFATAHPCRTLRPRSARSASLSSCGAAGLDVKQAFLQALFEGDGSSRTWARTPCRSRTRRERAART